MNSDTFRRALPDHVRENLPTELRSFRHASHFSFVQFWYSEPRFHYEVWPQQRYNIIEIGLHFEHKIAARNAAMHRFFDGHMLELMDTLGEMWLEQWDKGWHKLYRTIPLEPYSEALLDVVAREVARQMIVLEPFLREGLAALSEGDRLTAQSAPRARRD